MCGQGYLNTIFFLHGIMCFSLCGTCHVGSHTHTPRILDDAWSEVSALCCYSSRWQEVSAAEGCIHSVESYFLFLLRLLSLIQVDSIYYFQKGEKLIVERVGNTQFNSKIKYFVSTSGHGHFVTGVVEAGTVCPACGLSVCLLPYRQHMLVHRDKQDASDFTFGGRGVVTWQFQRSPFTSQLCPLPYDHRVVFSLFLFSSCKRELLMPPSLGSCEIVGTAHLV